MACLDRETPEYLLVAGKLYMADLYKRVFKSDNPPSLVEHINKMQSLGYYRDWNYTQEELQIIDGYLDHKSDFNSSYTSIKQYESKYFVKDIATRQTYETPQFLYARIALTVLENEHNRLEKIKDYLDLLKNKHLSLPSPNWEYIGTKKGMATSCCLYTAEDTSNSISALNLITDVMNTQSAGLGFNLQIRTKGDGVRNNRIEHLGKLPYLRVQEALAKSNKQGSRGGAITQYFPFFDPEVKLLIKARNPTTLVDDRVDQIDHAIIHNYFLAELVAKGEEVCLFSIKDVPDLYEAFYSKDPSSFKSLYNKYSKTNLVKDKIKARTLVSLFAGEQYETGRFYDLNIDEVNRHTPSQDPIYSSNLCVAPETTLLTTNGHQVISELEGQAVTIWNGFEWSDTVVVKTGTNQKLLTIKTNNGYSLDCTPYHKFYIFDGYGKSYKEVRAHELKPGDKLAKFDLPVIEGTIDLDNAYINGFYSGDGCAVGSKQRVYLYDEKIKLKSFIDPDNKLQWVDQAQSFNRIYTHFENLKTKYFVPISNYSIKSRLDWLAGYLDADGCVQNNGNNQSIVVASIELEFLKEIQLMLQTLGINSKIILAAEEGYRNLPANDGTGELAPFWCKTSHRLLLTSNDVYQLLQLGLKLNRLKVSKRLPQRDAKQFVKIESVTDTGRVDDTYCVTEPKRHMAVFNGILTGQCNEIVEPTAPFHSIKELFDEKSSEYIYVTVIEQKDELVIKEFNNQLVLSSGDKKFPHELIKNDKFQYQGVEYTVVSIRRKNEIALCNIAAINLNTDYDDETYYKIAYYALLTIYWVIENSLYPFTNLEYTSKARRNAGVGLTGLAYELARNNLMYSSKAGKEHIHSVAERHFYMLCKASIELAKQKGTPLWFNRSNYSKGWLPIDTYNKNVDTIANFQNKYDWEDLRQQLLKYGSAFSLLVAHMPCESSSQTLDNTNGLYPVRDTIVIKGDGANKNIFIVPEYNKLKHKYEIAWEVGYEHMIDCYAIVQKWTDQSISADYYEDFTSSWHEPLTDKVVLQRYLKKVKVGVKSTYYTNSKTRKNAEPETQEAGCGSGGCSL